MAEMRSELHTNPPLPGAYTPKKGDMCVAKFVDDLWYRARVEKVRFKNRSSCLRTEHYNQI